MNTAISIPGSTKKLGGDEVFFIAEIGKNFIQTEEDRPVSEYLENAKALVKAAKDAGADAVKFQTHEVEDEQLNINVVSPHFKGADRYSWITRNMAATPVGEFWKPLKAYCDEIGILFFSTPMSRKAAIKLEALGVPMWKIGSGDVHDHVTLDFIASTGKPLVISSGMVSLSELEVVIRSIQQKKIPLAVLYCVSKYPCPLEYFNLATIELLIEKYPEVVIGFSDHSVDGNEVDLAAIKLGARIIEKHFSFSRELWGSDHKASVLPQEFKAMVDATRRGQYKDVDVSKYFGSKERELEGAGSIFRPYFYKSLMAGEDIPAGVEVSAGMVYAMRPQMHAGGIPSERLSEVVGKKTKKSLKKFDPITESVLE